MSQTVTPQADVETLTETQTFTSPDEMEDAYDTFVDQITDLVMSGQRSDRFAEFLQSMIMVGSYSTRNKALIRMQRPDVVGPFNGAKQWMDRFGRVPEKGESGIKILAPLQITKCAESDKKVSNCTKCDDGCEETQKITVGFRYVNTFAYSQTVEMDDPPENTADIEPVTGKDITANVDQSAVKSYFDSLVNAYESKGNTVNKITTLENWDSISHANGRISTSDGTINIRAFSLTDEEEVSIESQFSTLVHEVAHNYLNHKSGRRSRRELEAEAVSYLVCRELGIETESDVYILSHLQSVVDTSDRESVRSYIEQSIDRIVQMAETILNEILEN